MDPVITLSSGTKGDRWGRCHLHFRQAPKYETGDYRLSDVFAMNPGRVVLTQAEYDELGKKIHAALED